MSKSILDLLFGENAEAEWKGRYGEMLTAGKLHFLRLLGHKGKVLSNVYIPKEDGETSEIDVMFLTEKGIFVIESKNYSGWIFGDENNTYWTVSLPGGIKNKLYNPIKQNETHIKWLARYLEKETGITDIPFFSFIVFSERCTLKKVSVYHEHIKVIKRDRLHQAVRDVWDSSPDVLQSEEVVYLYEVLKVYAKVDKSVKDAHVQSIKERYDAKEKNRTIRENAITSSSNIYGSGSYAQMFQDFFGEKNGLYSEKKDNAEGVKQEKANREELSERGKEMMDQKEIFCPRCGSRMVLRTAKRGANAGNQFYGCGNFPKCHFIRSL